MQYHFDILKTTREHHIKIANGLSPEALNFIPKGFNNNLIWNLGHVLVTQQLLCYGLSKVESFLDNDMITKYRKGSKPVEQVSEKEIKYILDNLLSSVDRHQDDLNVGVFKEYNTYITSYGITLNSIQEATIFNNVHEGLHLGTMKALKMLL